MDHGTPLSGMAPAIAPERAVRSKGAPVLVARRAPPVTRQAIDQGSARDARGQREARAWTAATSRGSGGVGSSKPDQPRVTARARSVVASVDASERSRRSQPRTV